MRAKIPPPILALITGLVMWLVARSPISFPIAIPFALAIFIALAALGLGIGVVSFRQFRAHGTTVNPLNPEQASSLVRSGIFGLSRNPMYIGLMLILAGWAIWLGSLSNLVVLVAFFITITELQIKPEETALKGLFGAAYDEYCERVRRWI